MAEDLRIQERWETVGTPLLRQHHDRFQNFTYHLELMAVTPVSHRIAVGDMPINVPVVRSAAR